MPVNVPMSPLRELCVFKSGGTPSKSNATFWSGEIPWVSPKDMKVTLINDATDHISAEAVQQSAATVVLDGSILVVVRSGILAHSFPVARVARAVAFNQDIKAIVPKGREIDPEYVYWFLRSREQQVVRIGVKKGATVHSVQSGFIEDLLIPIRPRSEQRRLVDLLSRAEGIVRLRREAQKKAAEIVPALFLDMFGDPTRNPKGWPETTIGEVSSYTRYGPRFHDRDYSDSGAHILRTTDIGYAGELAWWDSPKLAMSPEELGKYSLRPGTLLVTRTGATIGKTALFRGAEAPCIAGAYLIEVGMSSSVVPEYVLHLLLGNYGQAQLSRGTRTVAQPNINAPAICSIRLPLPDLERQRRFVQLTADVESLTEQHRRAEVAARAVFDALLSRAFGQPARP